MAVSNSPTAVMRMTAESGETRRACFITSMPLVMGILMSVTTTSYNAPSSFLRAESPEFATSTLWPSLRSTRSSNWQMERSSSQMSRLPMCHSSLQRGQFLTRRCGCRHARQFQDKFSALRRRRVHRNLPLMGLHDLIADRQSQAGSAFELRLKRFEDFFHQLRGNSLPGVGKSNAPHIAGRGQGHGQGAAARHGTHSVLAKIPENLLDLVSLHDGGSVTALEIAHHANAVWRRRRPGDLGMIG